jgi:hypothetical protein
MGYECSRPLINLVVNKEYIPTGAEAFGTMVEETLKNRGLSADILVPEPEENALPKTGPQEDLQPNASSGKNSRGRRKRQRGEIMNYRRSTTNRRRSPLRAGGGSFFDLDDHEGYLDVGSAPGRRAPGIWRTIKSRASYRSSAKGMARAHSCATSYRSSRRRSVRIINAANGLTARRLTGGAAHRGDHCPLGGNKMSPVRRSADEGAKNFSKDNMRSGIYTVLAIRRAHD